MPLFLRSLLAFFMLACPVMAQDRTITFQGSDAAFLSPERGWWAFAVEDFRKASQDEITPIRKTGATLIYGIVRLDAFKSKETLGPGLLADLDSAFAKARKAGVKVILRFAYNYPATSQEYENAKDAPLDIVLAHIDQLAPIIADNADTIAVMQAGFIGAWGEGHTSSNDLTLPGNKALIRDKLLEVIPESIALQWRYSGDLINWDKDEKRARFGMHNDCFLSSNTDVGTYSENAEVRATQRAAIAKISASTYFSGETCDAEPNNIRKACADILREGAQFHLQSLGMDYYKAFHNNWKSAGCFTKVAASMGPRMRLVKARFVDGRIRVTVINDGWAKMLHPRALKIKFNGQGLTLGPDMLSSLTPGKSAVFSAKLPAGIPDRICILAPDPSPRLAKDPRFSVRFANADRAGQSWADGQFCFKT